MFSALNSVLVFIKWFQCILFHYGTMISSFAY